jgi:lipid A ethanolaminephosphotransferase
MTRKRPMHQLMLVVVSVAVFFALHNATFWGIWAGIFYGSIGRGIVFAVAFFLLCCGLVSIFAFNRLLRPAIAILFILSAVTSFYMDQLGVVIDREMIQNVVSTTITEGKHLITMPFVIWVGLTGLLPALLVFYIQISHRNFVTATWQNMLTLLLCVFGFVGLIATDLKGNASVLRTRIDLKSSFQPLAPIAEYFRYVAMISRSVTLEFNEIGLDAVLLEDFNRSGKPNLTVVVVGETARAQNFSLGSYDRLTNPELAKKDIAYFDNVSSCGTSTAVSLPCMFSKFNRSEYSYERGKSHENVLDLIQRAGYRVEWIDNNTGDKGLADRVVYSHVTNVDDPTFCGEGECIDGILVAEVARRLADIQSDTVLVLHQIGSHGPSYYLRYPQAFEKFQPACRTSNFSDCTAQELTNSYDNTILYTDKVLADLVSLLAKQKNLITSMIYVSDHGESLGEKGLYLHGAPYFMAPDEQTKVPMIIWLSDAYQRVTGTNLECLTAEPDLDYSHANLFHTLLGMTGVQTAQRDPQLDIFDNCRKKPNG